MNLKLLSCAKSGDTEARNRFIEVNKNFIYRYSCIVCKRYLRWENDDELSIALLAFNSAIDSFQDGDFEAYCKMVIKSRLIDFFRKNAKNEIPIEDTILANTLEYSGAMDEKLDRASQVTIFKELLGKMGIDMIDLVKNSPKHGDTRKKLSDMALEIAKRMDMVEHLKKYGMLPSKDIISITGVSRRFLDDWRKYIIALIIIFSDKRLESIKDYIL